MSFQINNIHALVMGSAIKPEEGQFLIDTIFKYGINNIIETGMGKSTLYALCGLHSAFGGTVTSIDSCDPKGDHNYSNRYNITRQNILNLFGQAFLAKCWIPFHGQTSKEYVDFDNEVNCELFIHDSEHTEKNLEFELKSFKSDFFLCHDCIHDFATIIFKKDWFKDSWYRLDQARHYALYRKI